MTRWMRLLVGALALTAASATGALGADIYVTTTSQAINGSDGECSLREAIYSANFDENKAITSFNPLTYVTTECEAGSGDDTIWLPESAVFPMTAVLNDAYNPFGPTATPIVLSPIVIEGRGSRLVRSNPGRDFSGLPNFRVFAVGTASVAGLAVPGSGVGMLTIKNLHVRGFTAKGGNGAAGGGGGLGAGGAIFVRAGELTVESSTFQDNGAGGGNGVGGGFGSGGGGGGMGGHGGVNGKLGLSGGGGGGGARGDGGDGGDDPGCDDSGCEGGGGGGGGTLTAGGDAPKTGLGFGTAGSRCGGEGAHAGTIVGSEDGDDAACAGGGGGGGAARRHHSPLAGGNGGNGGYGGGGGGSGDEGGDGGRGGFGGGGGGAKTYESNISGFGPRGGDGGFGGGGGAGHGGFISGDPGSGGSFAGNASEEGGGGGAGLGGAIFSHRGTVKIYNSTFAGNFVLSGNAGPNAGSGRAAGAAIFAVDGSVEVWHSTISLNESTGHVETADAAGITVYRSSEDGQSAALSVYNTIIAGNGLFPAYAGARQCYVINSVAVQGSGNLIQGNQGCVGVASSADPALGPLQINAPGLTPTMAIADTGAAYNAADAAWALATDQRGVARPQAGGHDIGAYELLPAFWLSPIDPFPIVVRRSATVEVTANSEAGFSEDVTLAAVSPPNGFTVTFGTNPVKPPASGTASSAATVSLASFVKPGSYSFDISGAAGTLSDAVEVNVTVVATIASVQENVDEFVELGCIDSLGVGNAFKAKLAAADNLVKAGRVHPAVNTLGALRYQMQAQTGKHIATSCEIGGEAVDPADVLIAGVDDLIAGLAIAPNPVMGFVVTAAGAGAVDVAVGLRLGKSTVDTVSTDATGFYYVAGTQGLKQGATYEMSAGSGSKRKGGGSASQAFVWKGATIVVADLTY